jgi:hypothetical protein
MLQVEKIKIFLASPSDVLTERRYVRNVIDELNRTVAADKGVHFEIISSENAFPGYGKDGQAILNEQIGKMHEYELFIGIMWNRIGTPTPRAKSGTVEEFTRAVRALVRRKKPEVWFYFRQSAAHLTTKDELKQREEVLEFRARFKKNGLFRDYKTPANFRDRLREYLTLWLNARKGKVLKSQSTSSRKNTTTAGIKAKSESTAVRDPKKTASTSTAKSSTLKTALSATAKATTSKTTATNEPSTTSQKASSSKRSTTQSTRAVKNPKNWVMLDEKFFQTKLSETQSDRSILLQILPRDMEQASELKAFHPGEFNDRKQISFSDLHEAGIMQVSSVTTSSSAGKSSFSITLNPNQRSQNSGFGMEVNYQNYNADQVAELRARQILLGETLPREIGRVVSTQITGSHNHTMTIENGIFPDLWAKLQTQPTLFLPKAWLWAAYCLKIGQIVEDVLELDLGPIKNKVMPVRFRGKRKNPYSNQEPSVINVVGNCILSA